MPPPRGGALSNDTVWRLSRTSGRRAACAAGRLDSAYWLIGSGLAGLAQGCRCALPLQAWVGQIVAAARPQLVEAKDDGCGGDNWTTGALSRAKLQSWFDITTNKPTTSFLQTGCPSCRPTNSVKALKGKYHIPWTFLPQAHLGVFQLCLWPLIAPGYLVGGLPCLSSALWSQYHRQTGVNVNGLSFWNLKCTWCAINQVRL